ncbi:hypothetical protein J1614_003444 [Plenodomus biglobosus]|nr:hypothetical protein J1614_003444 [Plenodomus biglobosus]
MGHQHDSASAVEIIQATPSTPTPSGQDLNMGSLPIITDNLKQHYDSPLYDSPLYTEINIPLPRLPAPHTLKSPSQPQTSPPTQRHRSRTLSSLSPFHRRPCSPSSPPKDAEEWPRIRKEIVKSRETHAMMDLAHHGKKSRRGTIDALAVVPAVLVLSAELFTPGSGEGEKVGRRKDSGVGRWEDGIR